MRRSWIQAAVLLPIPIILALVVVAGQRQVPQPVVLPGAGSAAGGQAPKSLELPASPAPGWKLEGRPVQYDQKTLFDRINGAAPVYIRAGFLSSVGGEYRKQGAKEAVIYDVYDMGSGRQALGMYATERDPSYSFIKVGDEGYLASGSLNFWRGRYYVKLAGQEQGEAMDRDLVELATGLAKALPAAPEVTKELLLLRRLPAEQLPSSAGYAHTPLADVDGLAEVYFADYKSGETRYRLFIVREASAAAAAARLEKAKAYFEKDRAKVEEAKEGEARVITIAADSTAGLLVQAGPLLAGGVDLPDPALAAKLRPALLESLAAPAPEEKR